MEIVSQVPHGLSQEESDSTSYDTLEITSLPSIVSEEYLELYFNSSKSGGCDDAVKRPTMDCLPIPQFCLDFLLRSKTYLSEHPPSTEEVGHDFRGMRILLSCTICNVRFLLTQWIDLGCVGVY